METLFISVDPLTPDPEKIEQAAVLIRTGEVVGFPTETVYGLGADALNEDAVRKIFEAKGRPAVNPIIVHVADLDGLKALTTEVPENAKKLMDAFWPGPLTVILPKTPIVPLVVTGGLQTVAVRMPSHPVALALIRASGVPIAAPSANKSSLPSTTKGTHVLQDMDGKIPLILDCGPSDIGLESTVVDFTQDPPVILRPGGLSLESIQKVLPQVLPHGTKGTEKSPGTRFKHYSPKADVILIPATDVDKTASYLDFMVAAGRTVLLIGYQLDGLHARTHHSIDLRVSDYAKNIFSLLRDADAHSFDTVVIQGVEEVGIGVAVMDRLRRAAVKT